MMSSLAATLIDGSVLEGGGQLLRNSIALATLLSKPVTINNVRHSRKPPGLKPQHQTGLRLVASICSGQLTGAEKGSSTVNFHPSAVKAGHFTADTQTAGSTTLLLQVSLPCLLYSSTSIEPSTLTLRGGTNATQAPQIDYTEHIFLPFLRSRFGLDPVLKVRKRGYFPRGGGEVFVSLTPVTAPLPAVTLIERGAVKKVNGKAYVAGLPGHLAEEIKDGAVSALTAGGLDPALIDIVAVRERPEDAIGSGSGVVLWAETEEGCLLGGSAVGRKGKDMRELGREAAEELVANLSHGGCVDEYLQDQIIIFMALAEGQSTVKTGPLTLHTKTAIWIAQQLTTAKFEVVEDTETGQVIIRCEGIGMTASAPHKETTLDAS